VCNYSPGGNMNMEGYFSKNVWPKGEYEKPES